MPKPKRDSDYLDRDYVPPDEDSDSDMSQALDVEEVADELGNGDFEVEDLAGVVTIVSGPKLSQQQQKAEDQDVLSKAASDPRSADLLNRRKIRFAYVLESAKEAAKLKDQSTLDFSDNSKSLSKIPKKKTKMIECKIGNYIEESRTALGSIRLRQMTEQEIAKLGGIDTGDCQCEICIKRRSYNATSSVQGLRSGKKKGWAKYGQGRTLGGN